MLLVRSVTAGVTRSSNVSSWRRSAGGLRTGEVRRWREEPNNRSRRERLTDMANPQAGGSLGAEIQGGQGQAGQAPTRTAVSPWGAVRAGYSGCRMELLDQKFIMSQV